MIDATLQVLLKQRFFSILKNWENQCIIGLPKKEHTTKENLLGYFFSLTQLFRCNLPQILDSKKTSVRGGNGFGTHSDYWLLQALVADTSPDLVPGNFWPRARQLECVDPDH